MIHLKNINPPTSRLVFGLVVVVVIGLTGKTVNAASQTLPMTIRPANSSETATLNSLILPTVLPQSGANINTGFIETQQGAHVGRSWVAEVTPTLSSCAANPTIQIGGNHLVTHVANSVSPLPTPSDQPEAGALLLAGSGTSYGPVAGNTDLAVGASLNFVTSSASPATVVDINSGIKILLYVETRDDTSQNGAQASFTYSGIPQLQISYDDSACPVTTVNPIPGVPNTGVHEISFNKAEVLLPLSFAAALFGVYLRKRLLNK